MSGHYVVCGYGRMGSIIVKELKAHNIPVVIIEKNKSNLPEDEDIIYVEGDATYDEVLKSAGIEKAAGLITVLSSDAEKDLLLLTFLSLILGLNILKFRERK